MIAMALPGRKNMPEPIMMLKPKPSNPMNVRLRESFSLKALCACDSISPRYARYRSSSLANTNQVRRPSY